MTNVRIFLRGWVFIFIENTAQDNELYEFVQKLITRRIDRPTRTRQFSNDCSPTTCNPFFVETEEPAVKRMHTINGYVHK